ncbi:MAG: hypothetical protein V4689_13575 [Verrucomicrobiota bacterium]
MDTQIVIVKDFRGYAKVRIACGVENEKVLITSESGLLRMKNGGGLHPICFPNSAVFEFQPDVPECPDWSKLKPWCCTRVQK